MPDIDLHARLASTAFAFRGYNTTNLGRSRELLMHWAYGPVVEQHLRETSERCADILNEPVDLVERVRAGRESTLATFAEDIGLILAMERSQIDLLARFFDLAYGHARLAVGYSLGEVAALVCGEVFGLEDVMGSLVALAGDCAELAHDVTMGILFSRGPALELDLVERTCLEINQQGRGVISISSYLAPNSVLLLGQRDTVDRFKERFAAASAAPANLRKHGDRWPPLHTPILWQRSIPNRAAVMMHTVHGGFARPTVPVLSLVTGTDAYTACNSRDLLNRWIDHPQRLWDCVTELLGEGVDVVIHVGPAPNLLPATFKRLSDNIAMQLRGRNLNSLGLRAMSGIASRPWLTKLLTARATLLRAPFVQHVILEDWLLAQEVH